MTQSGYKYRVYGWRDGLNTRPMTLVENVQQAANAAVQMQRELQAFDECMIGLGPCNVRVELIEPNAPLPISDAQDAAQWNAAVLSTRINMAR